MNKIKGVVPVLHTPILNGDLDEASLEKLVDFLVTKDIGGLWVLGTGSEDMNLSFEQRLRVVKRVIETNANRKPLLVGTSFFCYDDILKFSSIIDNFDIYSIHLMPYHPLFSLERLEWMYDDLSKKVSHPLWLYTSGNWCRNIPSSFIEKLKNKYENIQGVKFSTSNTVDMAKVASLADDKFNVISAVISTFYSSLVLGVDGSTSSVGTPLPEILIEIYKLFEEKKYDECLFAQRKLNEFLSKWPKKCSNENFLKGAEEKLILHLRGLSGLEMTSYYKQYNNEDIDQMRSLLEKYYPEILD